MVLWSDSTLAPQNCYYVMYRLPTVRRDVWICMNLLMWFSKRSFKHKSTLSLFTHNEKPDDAIARFIVLSFHDSSFKFHMNFFSYYSNVESILFWTETPIQPRNSHSGTGFELYIHGGKQGCLHKKVWALSLKKCDLFWCYYLNIRSQLLWNSILCLTKNMFVY